ncbi:unnamed protein product [Periconia digitata]|uniref:Uncharacterized protein n=1 Tax=Periconia digitata TaxID=1303443 RepID=A0A9W4UNR8_9PLEO|nr:unnamed protein product [Periconia digitata]
MSEPQWSGPGIMQSFVTLKEGSKITQETLDRWFEEVYVPELIKTGIVTAASIWKAANPAYEKQNMILYEAPDLAPIKQGKLREDHVSRKSDMFPTDGPVDDFVDVESRILAREEYYEIEKQPKDVATTVIYAAMQPSPGGEVDLDKWYREEHNEQMSKEPGWKRTIRYRLLFQTRNDGKEAEGLDFLAIHEFDEKNKLGQNVQPLEPITDWTKKAMSECKSIDAAIYHKVTSSFRLAVSR